MGIFDSINLNEAKTSGGVGLPLAEGEYVAKIINSKGTILRDKSPAFEMFFQVTESSNPEEQPVGSIFNEFCPLKEDWGPAKAVIVLAMGTGLDPNSVRDSEDYKNTNWTKVMENVCAKPEILNGKLIRASVSKQIAKVSKKPYLRRTFGVHEDTRAAFQTAKASAKK